jgi:repressor LexA
LDNKRIFAKNLQRQMKMNGKSRRDVCAALGFSYYTFSDWVNGKKYPRMDKVEMLAEYFGILKSDLIEERTDEHREMQEKNSLIAEAVVRMQTDDVFMSVVKALSKADQKKLSSILTLLGQ